MKDIKKMLDTMNNYKNKLDENCVEHVKCENVDSFLTFLKREFNPEFTELHMQMFQNPGVSYLDIVIVMLIDVLEEDDDCNVDAYGMKDKFAELGVDIDKYTLDVSELLTAYYMYAYESDEDFNSLIARLSES